MSETLQERLRLYAGQSNIPGLALEAAAEIDRLNGEVERLQDRLEMRHAWQIIDGQKVRVEVEPGSIPDGIDCRNETIKLQDQRLDELRAEVKRLREALGKIADPPKHLGGYTREALSDIARVALARTP